MFEFSRNKEFFENLLHVRLDIHKPHIELRQKNLSFELPQRYAILFIGASSDFRKWNVEGFAKVGIWLKEKYGYEIVLCGANSDKDDALKFSKYFDGDYVDLVGKTSLVELLYVIYNGNHYGRFTPYPKEMASNYHVIYHPEIEKDLDNYKKLSNSYGFGSELDIHEISVDSVKNKIKEVLKR
jgi:ADP-heptose:LPS heptosyltransferase